MQLIWIGIGGALGSMLRFLLQTRMRAAFPGPFPLGTLSVNLIGSLLIGFLAGCFLTGNAPNQLKLFLMIGILGGFTTFSSFALENLTLLQAGQVKAALAYVLVSNGLGIGLAFGGFTLARALAGPLPS